MEDDETLINRYVGEKSEAAFNELVARYTGQVYSVARRQLGDGDLAKDATQSVFILLARKAPALRRHAVLAAWLFRATQLVVAGLRKREWRRQQRERKAAAMIETPASVAESPDWERIRPHLDDSIARLGETERAAVLLAFFHRLSHQETGRRLGLSEEAARKRIRRALEKMRAYFRRRGVAVSGELLLALLAAHSAEAAPAGLAAAAGAAVASGADAAVASLADEAGRSLGWLNWKVAAGGAAGGMLALGLACWGWLGAAPPGARFSGMSDASAAVWAGEGQFLVADDEVNHFNLYGLDRGPKPIQTFDFTALLQLDRERDETDWEGATRLGERAYWITSHGQNRKGKPRPSRHRLMAVDLAWRDGALELTPVGKPYTGLVEDLKRHPDYQAFGLGEAAQRAPKAAQALNIEGLCATPTGELLIGFRNPVPHGQALLARLMNPEATLAGEPARLAAPWRLDLGGLGVRDMTRLGDTYYVVAGPVSETGPFAVYEWRERGGPPRRRDDFQFGGLKPEALLIRRETGTNWGLFLSDDGTLTSFGRPMKNRPVANRWFRALQLPMDEPRL
jgi:RNA polymerase sigma factor (sigma-70 family)